ALTAAPDEKSLINQFPTCPPTASVSRSPPLFVYPPAAFTAALPLKVEPAGTVPVLKSALKLAPPAFRPTPSATTIKARTNRIRFIGFGTVGSILHDFSKLQAESFCGVFSQNLFRPLGLNPARDLNSS